MWGKLTEIQRFESCLPTGQAGIKVFSSPPGGVKNMYQNFGQKQDT